MSAVGDYRNVNDWLEGCARPMLVTHRGPDGDGVGAVAALGLLLRARGKTPHAVLYQSFPARYRLIEPLLTWHIWDEQRAALQETCDALVILDTCSHAQLEPLGDFLAAAPRTLVIDHHATNDDIGTRSDDLRLVDPTAAATCVLIAELARSSGAPLSSDIATALFAGVATDCGWFRFPNTDPRTLRVCAELMEAGAAADRIYAALYEQDAPGRVRLIGRMLQSLELHADGRLAVMYVRAADFAAAGANYRLTEDLVNEARRLAGTEATLLFTEQPDSIRVNFRSKTWLDVATLAQRFGGGGHVRAAGARLHGAWTEQVPPVIEATVAVLKQR